MYYNLNVIQTAPFYIIQSKNVCKFIKCRLIHYTNYKINYYICHTYRNVQLSIVTNLNGTIVYSLDYRYTCV